MPCKRSHYYFYQFGKNIITINLSGDIDNSDD